MAKQRIMLVEATPKKSLPPAYRTWDPDNVGPQIGLSNGNLTASLNAAHPTNWRGAVMTGSPDEGLVGGQWYWETIPTYTGAADFSVGVSAGFSLLSQLGVDWIISSPFSVGISRNGDVLMCNSVQDNVGPIPSGAVIRHWLDLDAGAYKVAVNAGPWRDLKMTASGPGMPPNGSPLILAFFLSSTLGDYVIQPHFAATSLRRPTGTTVAVTANFGAAPFVYPAPPGANAGLYTTPDPVPELHCFSSHPFGTAAGDDPPSQPYQARIVGDVDVSREGRCWVWGGQTQASAGSIDLINVDGALDGLAYLSWRDAQVAIYAGRAGDPRSAFTLWHRGVADRIEFDGRSQRARIVLTDSLAVYDTPIQPELYADEHPISSLRGRPVPLTLGIPFGVGPVLQSPLTAGPDAGAYQHHDGIAPALNGLGRIYDGGIDITAHCERWPAAPPYKGFRVIGPKPVGRVTIDASGNASTTLQVIIDNALARLDPDRGPALVVEQQPGGVDGIAAWAGLYIDQPQSILDVVRLAMDSVCGWACPTRDGTRLRLGRVREPAGHDPVLTLTPDNVTSDMQITLDTAPHLTTRIAGRRNYTPHSHSEIAASISDPASGSYDATRVADLMADWRVIRQGRPQVRGSVPLSDAYAQARTAQHRGTLMQQDHHVQAEANRVASLWHPTRHFVRLTALLGAVPADALEPGDIVAIHWPRFGMAAGASQRASVRLMVVAVRSRFFSRRVDLTLWGSLPREQP